MIDNNIISSLGAGSGIDTKAIVKQLTEIEGAAKQLRIDSTREKTEAKISDFGLLKSSLATLQTSLKALTDPEGMFSKSASFTESDSIVPEKLGTEVSPGTYSLKVLETAQAQSLSSLRFSDPSEAVGEGTLTFRFGSWGVDGFAVDAEKEGHSITIDQSNNTLKGLRDAINKADFGVQASIVNDGTGYRLLVAPPSGASNELEITVDEGLDPANNVDNLGLSRFAFNGNTIDGLESKQSGRDARLNINGLEVTRSTNQIDDVVDGFSFSVVKPSDEVVNVTITEDKAFAEQKIREFVEAYNTFRKEIEPLFSYGDTTKTEDGEEKQVKGSLATDSLAKSVISQLRTTLSAAVPGLSGEGYSALTNVGIRTERDGSISIHEEDFRKAIDNNFELVQELFAPSTYSNAVGVEVNGYQDRTVPGVYDVVIEVPPAKGSFTAGASADIATGAFDTTLKSYTFHININGTTSAEIALPTGKQYTTADELVDDLQSLINADPSLKKGNDSVVVAYENGKFTFTSNEYGSKSKVSFVSPSADFAADFGITAVDAVAVAGKDVKGTVDGKAAFGSGNVLLPDLKSDASGLGLRISENVQLGVAGTVGFSRGFAGGLSSLIDSFQKTDGAISARTESLSDTLETLDEDQKKLDRRLSAFQERMMQQFLAMENILNGLNSSGGFLENLVDTLPFTAKK